MSSRPTDKDVGRLEREIETYEARAYRKLCVTAVKRWNAAVRERRRAGASPTIGIAIEARFCFLDVHCPGCGQTKQIDLRQIDRHPRTRLEALIPSLSCRNCRPNPPFARLLELSEHAWQSPNRPAFVQKRET
jgi:hypothetical protein